MKRKEQDSTQQYRLKGNRRGLTLLLVSDIEKGTQNNLILKMMNKEPRYQLSLSNCDIWFLKTD